MGKSKIKNQKSKSQFKIQNFGLWTVSLIFAFCILNFNCYAQTQEITPTQRKISLDIKGMDILDVLKMISQRGNLNIVSGRNVTGRVTVFLRDVDIWDAFEIILLANDLAYEKKGDIINVMTSRDYELLYGERFADKKQLLTLPLKYAKASSLAGVLNQIKSNIGRVIVDEPSNTLIVMDIPDKLSQIKQTVTGLDRPLETKIFILNYTQVEKLGSKIQELITNGIGQVRIDERTNKIAITDYPERLDEIEKIITAFDEKTQQVLIDAQIIEIKPSDKFEMGVDWDYWIEKNFRLAASLPTSGAAHKLSIGTAAGGGSVGGKGEYKGIIDILRTIGETKILSSPRIIALNNQEAKILVGSKEAYASQTTVTGEGGTVTTSEAITFVDVGIKLYVTPTINREGFVTMKIRPEISSVGSEHVTAKGEKIPEISISETETSVMIKDGVTVIIGGLRKDERHKTVKKIPLMGDIPLLGFFFRSTSDELKKTELVILLTPHIMSGESPYTDFSEIKPTEGAVVKMEKGKIVTERISVPGKSESQKIELSPVQYYDLIRNQIKETAKQKFPKDLKGEVEFSFSLLNTGELLAEPKILKITDDKFIPLALKVLRDTSPFPPFPESIKKEKEVFYIIISYE